MNRRSLPLMSALLAATLLVAACSGGSDTAEPADTIDSATTTVTVPPTTTTPATTTTTTTIPATTTTVDVEAVAAAYTEPGPFPVGVSTLALADGTAVEVWYPAVDGTTGDESYDVRDFTSPDLRALLTADVPAIVTYGAGRDADLADGAFPVVLFSHGFLGFRSQSTFLTAHLASWGMIVAAPDHPSRDLFHLLELLDFLDDPASRPPDTSVDGLLQTLDLLVAEGESPTSRFAGHVDAEQVVAVGHSAGGGTVLRAASTDDRIDGYVSMASGVFTGRSTDTAATTTLPTLPEVPSFFLAGTTDSIVPTDTVTRVAFELATSPTLLWVIEGAGHQAFSDLCTVGNGTGIIGVARASGLGELLDSLTSIVRLGEDGCVPPSADVATTFPIIRHAVTAWIRATIGVDAEPVGLGPEVAAAYAVPVQIETR